MKKYLFLFLLLGSPGFAFAATAPLETPAREVFLEDATTGAILFEKNADQRMPTSSMSKLMTAYVVFEAIKEGKTSLDDTAPISERAWKMEGSKMFVKVGESVKVGDLLQGMIVQSGNDASVALAEKIGGSEEAFADLMNETAKKLGLESSHFKNATGWPDPEHYSTARDLANLARFLMRDFPEHYHYYSQIDYTYNGIKQGNRNPLLYRKMGADGLKTGHTEVAGYGLTASVNRGNQRLILVVNGLPNVQARADESAKIIEWGFREFANHTIAKEEQEFMRLPVWYGQAKHVSLVAEKPVTFTLPRGVSPKVTLRTEQPVTAPVSKGQPLGRLEVEMPGTDIITIPLVAGVDVPALGFFGKIARRLGFDE